jgi:crotonobetainyl-CoA:carnitine CoA-transferase CaiB-like acyl-CoA transferase
MTTPAPLAGLTVVEIGRRDAVSICGSLLAQLGATVLVEEPKASEVGHDPYRRLPRALAMAGKLCLPADREAGRTVHAVDAFVFAADVVIRSSDVDPARFSRDFSNAVIDCDITAFGASGPMAGQPASEMQLQALCAYAHTTGEPAAPPLLARIPLVSYLAGANAAAAIVAGLLARRTGGGEGAGGQAIEVAMFDCAFLGLNAVLAGVLTGVIADRTRIGNGHPSIAAWNLYCTADGFVQICAGNQNQWERLCRLMDRADLAAAYPSSAARLAHVHEIDAVIAQWTGQHTSAHVVCETQAAGIAAGPIAQIDGRPREPNLDMRAMITDGFDPVTQRRVNLPASPLALRGSPPVAETAIPIPGSPPPFKPAVAPQSAGQPGLATDRPPPLAGVTVIELGQYTTAPMCGRILGMLGADVIKIEKPGGDESRSYEPRHGERSEAYCLNNTNKRSIVLDLQSAAGLDELRRLVASADVLLENNKPGTIDKFGLSRGVLEQLNPRLVHCSISGFGVESLYRTRPGFDTVIQAMSGLMAAINPGGIPMKTGISASDVMGAQLGLLSILAALAQRAQSGMGQFIDLSMQDASCWMTGAVWNGWAAGEPFARVCLCSDGYIVVDDGLPDADRLHGIAAMTRGAAVANLAAEGWLAAPVQSLREMVDMPQTHARSLWRLEAEDGRQWPVPGAPFRFSATVLKNPDLAPRLGNSVT